MQARQKALDDIAEKSEASLKERWGDDWDLKVTQDPENPGTIAQTCMKLSEELDLDYNDEAGNKRSHLKDCLELERRNGRLGDLAPILLVLDYIHGKWVAEGTTLPGEPQTGKGAKTDAGAWDEYPEMDDPNAPPSKEQEWGI